MRLLILLLPWFELFTLIQLGVETSALTALGYVLCTLLLGLWLLRRQGLDIFQRLVAAQQGVVPGPQLLLDDMALGLAAVLLMVPGLLSDVAALVVMIGPLRRRLARWLGGPQVETYRPEQDRAGPTTLEGDYRRVHK